ncbi:MAG: CDP-diacylglycerol-serine O-phosphatidyltransferase [Phycisphaerales bacterium]|nr:CDP-diacylglycerol-serine O-phosphatidyltransferase [Phycisphaerales bacterium]
MTRDPQTNLADSTNPDDPRAGLREGAVGTTGIKRPRLHALRRLRRRERDGEEREARRLRIRRHGRRAYIRSVYSLPSLATLGNAICGFGAMYVSALDPLPAGAADHWTKFFFENQFFAAAYLIFVAMVFDGLDGRLARFARHTTDFGGQLDSLADVISFGCAPAFIALQLFHSQHPDLPPIIGRTVWAIGALYVACAAIRLARFNVSNEHGEQHHYSFLGLPSPGAAGAVAAFILMQQDLYEHRNWSLANDLSQLCLWLLPGVVLLTGLLMVSTIRYPHLVNRYLRGRRSIARLMVVLIGLLLMVIVHRYTLGIGALAYALWGLATSSYHRFRPRPRSDPTV